MLIFNFSLSLRKSLTVCVTAAACSGRAQSGVSVRLRVAGPPQDRSTFVSALLSCQSGREIGLRVCPCVAMRVPAKTAARLVTRTPAPGPASAAGPRRPAAPELEAT